MLNRDSLLFSPTREGVPSSDDNFTANDLIAAQDALEAEARDVLPFSFGSCTFDLGYIKQPLYACTTCLRGNSPHNSAVCAACSIACHGEHDLVELFNRRGFRCDCGTARMGAGSCCSISPRSDAPTNAENHYDKNFDNVFCICGRDYDPHSETDSMYQCVVCEDWLHHACLLGSHAELEDSPLGPDDFDQLICDTCISTDRRGIRKLVERYAGRDSTGVMVVDGAEVLGRASIDDDDAGDGTAEEKQESDGVVLGALVTSEKRKVDPEGTDHGGAEPAAKRSKAEGEKEDDAAALPSLPPLSTLAPSTDECKAPPLDPTSSSPLARLEKQGQRMNVYLEEGWMMRWCRCSKCLPYFFDFPYLLEEEEVYEPPEDTEAHRSTMDLGMEALSRMPRAQAIEGAIAFQGLSDRLKAFLRPHAEAGTTVTKELIDEFFEREKEARS